MTTFPTRDPQLMYEVARDRLSTQLDFIDAIDGKIAMLVSIASALLGIAAAVFALHTTSAPVAGHADGGLSGWEIATLVIGAVSYTVVVAFGMNAYLCRDWDVGPSLRALWDQHGSADSDERIKWGVAVDTWLGYEANKPTYDTKERALKVAFFGTALETLVLVAAISLVASS